MNSMKLYLSTFIFLGLFSTMVKCNVILVNSANETVPDEDTDDDYDYDYECSDGEFDCGGSECILESHLCDGTEDCGDGIDEKNCPEKNVTCTDEQFDCGNGICILKEQKCDGLIHCTNNADELECKSGNVATITTTQSTTTVPEITEYDDGFEYDVDCNEDEYKCSDEICIKLSALCSGEESCAFKDMDYDCNETITNITSCNENEFQCGNGSCITASMVCDGKPQCDDSSDEANCTVSTSTIVAKILTHATNVETTSSKACHSTNINISFICFLAIICIAMNWK